MLAVAAAAAGLAACGQKGPLFLPTEPAAAQRATLPQTLRSSILLSPTSAPTAPLPAAGASTPAMPATE